MRHLTLLLSLLFCTSSLFAQDDERLIEEGIDLHDRGYLDEAIAKYDSMLLLRPGNYRASYEKAMTLTELKRYDAAKALCQQIIERNPDSSNKMVYVIYGTILDYQKQPEQAIDVYTKGIRSNPKDYALYFNRAVTYAGLGRTEDAVSDLQQALARNPFHPGSHNLLALIHEDNKVYALMANLAFLSVENQGERARQALARVEGILFAGAKRKSDSSIAINLSLGDLTGDKKKKTDDFHQVELIMALGAALNFEEKYKNENPPQRLRRNLDNIIAMMGEEKKAKGFGWKYYVPFFTDLRKAGHLETFSYMAYASQNVSWLKANPDAVKAFREWLEAYAWPKIK
ncbi:MAG: tetratricopeptide repeat protein [Chitinophagaceae bacterium]|nr:MAG: tetratricopeptide repeat protein [Chitinophagaceae bacterium]